jgi:hypothetical protein
MHTALRTLLFAAALALAGCASSPNPPAAPLPDGRDLSEDPLEVTRLPQP